MKVNYIDTLCDTKYNIYVFVDTILIRMITINHTNINIEFDTIALREIVR